MRNKATKNFGFSIGRSEQKKIFCSMLGALLFALCVAAEAQQPRKVPRIGYLAAGDAASESTRSEPIRLALREHGYIEGQNIDIEYRYEEGKRDPAPALAAELVLLKVHVLVVTRKARRVGTVKNAAKTIQMVMVG